MTNPLDHDGDGKAGGSRPDPERQAIIAALKAGDTPFFKGATTAKLREVLAAAARDATPAQPDQPQQEAALAAPTNLATTVAAPTPEQVEAEAIARAKDTARQVAEATAAALAKPSASEARLGAEKKAVTDAAFNAAAARDALNPQSEPMVKVRITRLGENKVSMGFHAGGAGDAYYRDGEEPSFPQSVAQSLIDRYYADPVK